MMEGGEVRSPSLLHRRMTGMQSPLPPVPSQGGINSSPPRRPSSQSPIIGFHPLQLQQQQIKQQLQLFQQQQQQQQLHIMNGGLSSMKSEKMGSSQNVGGIFNAGRDGDGGGHSASSPPPVSSNPENNTCRVIDYRGVKVAAFDVDGRELICLPQAFELFLKHLVGGLHTVYTKLKRLDVTPVVCNVEQVRVLRGLGAIQPGVNRCKLISPKEFDILYDDCTNSSARPGRPPKRSALSSTPDGFQDKLKRTTHRLQMTPSDFYSPPTMIDQKKTYSNSSGIGPAAYLSSFATDFHKSSPLGTLGGPGGPFVYNPNHLAHHLAAAFMPLGPCHPGMMSLGMGNHTSLRSGGGRGGLVVGPHGDHMTVMAAAAAAAAAHERNRSAAVAALVGGDGHGHDVTSSTSRARDYRRLLGSSAEHNNNNNNNRFLDRLTGGGGGESIGEGGMKLLAPQRSQRGSPVDMDGPLNLETHNRSSERRSVSVSSNERHSSADSCERRDSANSQQQHDDQRRQPLLQQLSNRRQNKTVKHSTCDNVIRSTTKRHKDLDEDDDTDDDDDDESGDSMDDVSREGRESDHHRRQSPIRTFCNGLGGTGVGVGDGGGGGVMGVAGVAGICGSAGVLGVGGGVPTPFSARAVANDQLDDRRSVGSPRDSLSPASPQCYQPHRALHQQHEQQQQLGMNPSSCSEALSLDELLSNIQALVKLATETARQREKQMNYERTQLALKMIEEKQLRESIERKLEEEQKTRVSVENRLRVVTKRKRDSGDTDGQTDCHANNKNEVRDDLIRSPHQIKLTPQKSGVSGVVTAGFADKSVENVPSPQGLSKKASLRADEHSFGMTSYERGYDVSDAEDDDDDDDDDGNEDGFVKNGDAAAAKSQNQIIQTSSRFNGSETDQKRISDADQSPASDNVDDENTNRSNSIDCRNRSEDGYVNLFEGATSRVISGSSPVSLQFIKNNKNVHPPQIKLTTN